MKATSFLNMVTLLTATAKSDKEIDDKLAKLILLYNKPPKNLCCIFSNLYQLEICQDAYFDKEDNTLLFDKNIFSLVCKGKKHKHKMPRNINELISTINATKNGFALKFQDSIIKGLDLNPTFKEVMSAYGL